MRNPHRKDKLRTIFNPGALVVYVGLLVLVLETQVLSSPTLVKGKEGDGNIRQVSLNPGMIKHPSLQYNMRREKIFMDIKDFIAVSADLLDLQSEEVSKLENWLRLALGKNSPDEAYEITSLVDHAFNFMKENCNEKYLHLSQGASEFQVKKMCMKKFGLLTLEEGIEAYKPASEVQRNSIQLFALGTRALDRKTSSLQEYWYFEHLEDMLERWKSVSSPENTTLISWKRFRTLLQKSEVSIEIKSDQDLAKYFRTLGIWDIGNEKEKISIPKLMHYTFLYFYEKDQQL
ncbi:hypothetical protein PtA15_11A577 [Puccinia triticina]|uniref:Uncharacterized protein n=1 Tax=Puccinia triticina TaxID=208348 RepID=A0ABY7D1K3_9BASI|nr:uncharacterized protein PtA15_11A577 [Puccinia triticina]WAQ89885.1 hypothetical protein PtA15_11A577 [Puccinia triticina]